MESTMWKIFKRGMVVGVVMGLAPVVVGCVSRSAFEAEVEKNQHLQYVKTEQDIEREGLHADVGALRRAYSEQSLRMTFLEGVVQQTSIELKQIDAKLTAFDGKLSGLSQDAKLQQGEFVRVTAQGAETMRLLESMREKQEESRQALVGVAAKLEGMKRVVTSRPVALSSEVSDGKGKGKGDKVGTSPSPKGPSEEQKLSSRQIGGQKDTAQAGGVELKKDAGVSDGKGQAGSSLSDPGTGGGESPVLPEKVSPVVQGSAVGSQNPIATNGATSAEGSHRVDTGDRSPLITSTSGPAVSSENGTPVKKTWADWASDKLDSAKQAVMGKKPVQTAAEPAGSATTNPKK